MFTGTTEPVWNSESGASQDAARVRFGWHWSTTPFVDVATTSSCIACETGMTLTSTSVPLLAMDVLDAGLRGRLCDCGLFVLYGRGGWTVLSSRDKSLRLDWSPK